MQETKEGCIDIDVNDNGLHSDQDTFIGFVVGLQVVCLSHS